MGWHDSVGVCTCMTLHRRLPTHTHQLNLERKGHWLCAFRPTTRLVLLHVWIISMQGTVNSHRVLFSSDVIGTSMYVIDSTAFNPLEGCICGPWLFVNGVSALLNDCRGRPFPKSVSQLKVGKVLVWSLCKFGISNFGTLAICHGHTDRSPTSHTNGGAM